MANGDYMKARSEMAYAQYLAGVAFNNASLGYVHAMAHQLGGYYNLPHGVCNAILLPYVQEFNLIGNLERFAVIAKAMDLNVDGMSPFEAGEACVYGLKTFGRYLGIPQNLRSLGVDPADFEVMEENAMKDAGITAEDIDYVNAHGTSTHHNDLFETKAIKLALGDHAEKVKINSTKSMIGHLLGAAGGVEFITCVKSIQDGFVHATVGLEKPGEGCDLDYTMGDGVSMNVDVAISNSLGFGGHNASLIVKKFSE